MIAVLIVFHAGNEKKRIKRILKQDSNSRQRQYIVPVSNLKARKIKTLLSLTIHLVHHPIDAAAVDLLLLRCCSTIAPLSLCYRSAVAALSLHCCYAAASVTPAVAPAIASAVAPMSLRCRSAVAPLSLWCCSAIPPLSVCFRSVFAPLSLLSLRCRCCCSFCRYDVIAAIATAVTPLSLLLLLCCHSGVTPLSFRYQSSVVSLLLRCRCCHSCYCS